MNTDKLDRITPYVDQYVLARVKLNHSLNHELELTEGIINKRKALYHTCDTAEKQIMKILFEENEEEIKSAINPTSQIKIE